MRTTLFTFVVFCLCLLGACAEEVAFDGGTLSVTWSEDNDWLVLEAAIDSTDVESHVWVLTAIARRFEDGVFAWQLHVSETMDSVIVLPNDFLTARHFSTAQLGIETVLTPGGHGLAVRIPSDGPILRFIAPGDALELHALWVQQAPLVKAVVPPTAVADAGGGGAGMPADGVASSPLPRDTTVRQGEEIAHRFVLSSDTGDGMRVVLSYTLMRLHDDQPSEFARFAHIEFDPATAEYAYSIDTSSLPAGAYRLIIGSSDGALSYRAELTIVSDND